MATEIASLGLKADSTGVVRATSDLDRLTDAAKDAQKAADDLSGSARRTGTDVKKGGDAARGAAGDTKKLKDETSSTEGAFVRMAAGVSKVRGAFALLAASGIGAAVAGFTAMSASLANTAFEIERFARASNASAGQFQEWAAGAKRVGLEQSDLADILKDMNDRLGDFRQTGGGELADFFEKIAPKVGITADAFKDLSGPDALLLFVSSLEKAGASQQDMIFYMEALSSNSTHLLPLLRNGGLAMKEYGQQARDMGAVLSGSALAALNRGKQAMFDMDLATQGLSNTIGVAAAPALVAFASAVTTVASFVHQHFNDIAGIVIAAAGAITISYLPAIWGAISATYAWVAALVTLRGALVATGFGAVIVAAGLLIGKFLDLVQAVGGFGRAFELLWDVAKEGFQSLLSSSVEFINRWIGMYRGAFAAVVAVWGDLPGALGDLAYQAGAIMLKALVEFAQKAIIPLRMVIEALNFVQRMRGAEEYDLSKVVFGENGLNNPFTGQAAIAGQKAGEAFAAGFQKNTLDPVAPGDLSGAMARLNDALENPVSSKGTVNNGASSPAAPASGAGSKEKSDPYKELIANADRRIASLQAETEALGLTEEAAARMRYEQEMLNQASQKDIELSPTQRAEIRGRAEDMAYWEVAAKKVKEAYDFVRDGVKGFISDFRQGLQNGEGALQSFVNAASNLLDKLISKIEDQLVDALMKAFDFGGLGGGSSGGGLLDGLLSFIIPNAKGGVYASAGLSAYSNSVVSQPTLFAFASGAGLMGEAGPEAIMPLSRGSDGRLGVQVHQGNAGGGGGAANVTVAPVYNIQTSGGKSDNEDLKKVLDQSNADLRKMVQSVLVEDLKKMGPTASAMKSRFGLNETRGIG